jgi:hypothetical protein
MARPGRLGRLFAGGEAVLRLADTNAAVNIQRKFLQRIFRARFGDHSRTRKRRTRRPRNLDATIVPRHLKSAVVEVEHLIFTATCFAGVRLQRVVELQVISPACNIEAIELGFIQGRDQADEVPVRSN